MLLNLQKFGRSGCEATVGLGMFAVGFSLTRFPPLLPVPLRFTPLPPSLKLWRTSGRDSEALRTKWARGTEIEFGVFEDLIRFTKMQGIGNDFVMVDTIQEVNLPGDLAAFARVVNDRRFGIGGDGLILLERGESAPFKMRMFNPDGSESEMCGNGIRCFARLLQDHGHIESDTVDVETGAGTLTLSLVDSNRVRVDMGVARLTRGEIGMAGPTEEKFIEQSLGDGYLGTAVSMGNPHVVIFVDDVAKIELETIGPKLEHHSLFPRRVNVHFVQVVDRGHLIQRTWERGAGITLACGTGACSCGVAAFLTGRADRSVEIQLPGGKLEIEYAEDGHVFMTGPAETVFEGSFGNELDS